MSQPSTSTPPTPSSELPEANVKLTAADAPESISELFRRDPKEWSDGDWRRAIAEYRQVRVKLGEKQTKTKPPKEVLATEGKSAADLLGDLGI